MYVFRTRNCCSGWRQKVALSGPAGFHFDRERLSEMVEKFFSVSISTNSIHSKQWKNDSGPITLLSGPPSSGKTSLAFQFGVNAAASHPHRYVVFLCKRSKLLNEPPYLSQGIDPSSPIFDRIQIKYVDDEQGLKRYFAAFHLLPHFPVAVIVDDFADLFDERICQERYGNPRGRDLAMVRLLSLCQNAVAHANKTSPCELLLSDTHQGDSSKLMFIYKRWISSVFLIKGHGPGSFLLQNTIHPNTFKLDTSKVARYSIAFQHLLLDRILEASQL